MNVPITAIGYGSDGGRLNASSIPVTIAERSSVVSGLFMMRLHASSIPVTIAERSSVESGLFIITQLSFSHSIAESTQTPVSISALPPNCTADITIAGTRAIRTWSIIFAVVWLLLT